MARSVSRFTRSLLGAGLGLGCLALVLGFGGSEVGAPASPKRLESLGPVQALQVVGGCSEAGRPDAPATGKEQQLRKLVEAQLGRLNLRFEPNRGQADSRARFLSRGSGYTIFLTETGAVLALERLKSGAAKDVATETVVLGLRVLGANAGIDLGGERELPGKTNYLIGREARSWQTGIPNFAQVRYGGVYPGVDLVFYGSSQRQLEYDFVVGPGADPGRIRMKVDGAERLSLDESGNLVIEAGGHRFLQQAPVVYQERQGRREEVVGRYLLEGAGAAEYGFEVAAYDRTRTLVIDPVVGFATYLGATSTDDLRALGVDSKGFIYAGGATGSSGFPSTVGAFQTSLKGALDGFVCKFTPDGTQLVYSTFLGGLTPVSTPPAHDVVTDLKVSASGKVYLTGYTQSSDFPLASAFQGAHGGGGAQGRDAFVTCLNATGSGLVYSSYLGGSGDENALKGCIALDGSENAFVGGSTASANFPKLIPMVGSEFFGGSRDGFVARIDPAGSKTFASFFGSTGFEDILGIQVHASGNLYVCGRTDGTLPVARAAQGSYGGGGSDGFLSRFAPVTSSYSLDYSTYLGGSLADQATDIAVAVSQTAYVTGGTLSSNYPVTGGVIQAARAGAVTNCDAFVTSIPHTVSGTASIGFSTYLGGTSDDNFDGSNFYGNIGLDNSGNIWITGRTHSTDLPLNGAFQATNTGAPTKADAFVAGINGSGTSLIFSSYYGGSDSEFPYAMAVEKSCAVIFGGFTQSSNLPLTTPFLGTAPDTSNGFLVKLLINLPASSSDSYTVNEDSNLSVPDTTGVLANDTCAAKATLVTNVAQGSLTLNGDGSFLYTPNPDFSGTDSFTYRASNASISESGNATVTLTVSPVADTPVANNDSYGGSAGRKLGIPKPGVLGNDTDAEQDALSATLVSGVTQGTLTLNADGSFEYLPADGFTGTDSFTYQATDGTLTSNTATVTLTTALATDVPSVELAADPAEGFAPLTPTFTATASDPNGAAISQYVWNFGDDTTQTTSGATVTHTYSTAGSFVVSLFVTNANGLSSDPVYLPIPVADGETGDGDLFLSTLKFKINFGQHNNGQNGDSLSFGGLLNPAGLPDDMSGALLRLRFNNGLELGSGAPRSRMRSAQPRDTQNFIGLLNASTGQLKVKAQKVDLRTVLGVKDKSAKEKIRTEVEVEVEGVSIDTPVIKGVIEADLSSVEGKSASSSFNFLTLGNATLTGVIKSQRTGAIEADGGGHLINAQGPLVSDLSNPFLPTGDLTITIGSASQQVVLTVPLAALKQSGSGAGSILTYSKSLQEVAELKKLQINNKTRKFILSTNELAGTGIPAVGSGILEFDLPIAFDAPTAEGNIHLATTVQIKRSSDSSKVWKR